MKRIEVGDRVTILRPLTVSSTHGRVVTISEGSRPFGVLLRDLTYLTLSDDEIEWEAGG